jgi:hypothetical protein
MFNTTFDIRNVWIITLISIILVLIFYICLARILRRKYRIRLYSHYSQTEPITIVEYDQYGQPYINGYQAVLYGQV